LIFSVRRGAKSGGFVVQLDESVLTAVEELRALVAEEASQTDAHSKANRSESSLSVREVQSRLRRGRSIDQVAREAGVDTTWVARFAVPVLAEQTEIIRAARGTRMTRQRVGLSGATLGDSVYRNLAERGLADPDESLDEAWRARQLTEGMWLVAIKYSLRGRESEAEWEYDEAAGELRARGRLATELGFRESKRRGSNKPRSATPASTSTKATKAKPPTTARRSSSRQAPKRVAAARRAAEARMVSKAEKAGRRNASVVRKAAKKPVVVPPRRRFEPRPFEPRPWPDPLLVEEQLDEPKGWGAELDLALGEIGPKQHVEEELEDDLEPEDDVEPKPEPEPEPELEVEIEAPPVRPTVRREPLRARAPDPSSPAERARRRVRLRSREEDGVDVEDPAEGGNGPVFRSDLAQPASGLPSFPQSAMGQSPQPPLPVPFEPIEPARRRRRRPLRGR
jgi:hypothetical protein